MIHMVQTTYGLVEHQGIEEFHFGDWFDIFEIDTWMSSACKLYIGTWGKVYTHSLPPPFHKNN